LFTPSLFAARLVSPLWAWCKYLVELVLKYRCQECS
jgi:hypothetical protein